MYPLVKAAYTFFGLLSFYALRKTGRTLGSLCYYLLAGRRKTAIINCRIIGIEKNIKKVVKDSFRHTFCAYMESFYCKRVDSRFLDEKVEVELIDGAEIKDSQYFAVSAHFGSWELAPYILTGKLGLKGAAVARKIKNPKVDEFLKSQRSNANAEYIHHRGAGEKINEYMDKGMSIGVLLDHSSMPKDSFAVPFFGVNTTFMKGVPIIAVRRNIPILPLFMLRTEKGVKALVYPEISPDKTLKPKARAVDLAHRINLVYEKVIKQYPEQWYLIHKRFKRTADENGEWTSGKTYD